MDIVLAPDPVVRARAFLKRYVAERVEARVPPDWGWVEPLVLVRDGGGSGERSRVLHDARITLEVSAPSRPVASALARKVAGVLREWPTVERDVFWGAQLSAPAYFPDDATGTPLYTFTVAVAFRGESATVAAI